MEKRDFQPVIPLVAALTLNACATTSSRDAISPDLNTEREEVRQRFSIVGEILENNITPVHLEEALADPDTVIHCTTTYDPADESDHLTFYCNIANSRTYHIRTYPEQIIEYIPERNFTSIRHAFIIDVNIGNDTSEGPNEVRIADFVCSRNSRIKGQTFILRECELEAIGTPVIIETGDGSGWPDNEI